MFRALLQWHAPDDLTAEMILRVSPGELEGLTGGQTGTQPIDAGLGQLVVRENALRVIEEMVSALRVKNEMCSIMEPAAFPDEPAKHIWSRRASGWASAEMLASAEAAMMSGGTEPSGSAEPGDASFWGCTFTRLCLRVWSHRSRIAARAIIELKAIDDVLEGALRQLRAIQPHALDGTNLKLPQRTAIVDEDALLTLTLRLLERDMHGVQGEASDVSSEPVPLSVKPPPPSAAQDIDAMLQDVDAPSAAAPAGGINPPPFSMSMLRSMFNPAGTAGAAI